MTNADVSGSTTPPVPVSAGHRGPTESRLASRVVLAVYVLAALAYVVICIHLPVQFNVYADKDDAYFISKAQLLTEGHWFGGYDQLTLIKGPGFTYFLALSHLLGLSSTLALSLVFVGSCGLFVGVARRSLQLPKIPALVLFVGLLYQPALMPSRVIRDSLYQSLFLLALAGMITLTLDQRRDRGFVRSVVWGLPVGLFWITREEGIWVLPGFALFVLARLWVTRRHGRMLLSFAGALVAFAVGAAVPIVGTSLANQSEYGTFTVTDINAAPFQGAMTALDTISSGREISHVLVSRQALRDAFEASPAFDELRADLESPDNVWLAPGCAVYPSTCGEYGGGWFGWAVRDAAFAAGHYSSASEASRYFSQVASELNVACARGTLQCTSSLLPVGPVVSPGILKEIPAHMWKGVRLTSYGEGSTIPLISTVGPSDRVADFSDYLGDPLLTASTETTPVVAPENESRWVQGREMLADAYGVGTPIALVLGLVAFAAGVVLTIRKLPVHRRMLTVAAVCWVLYASRLGLVSLVDITSSPAITAEYLAPAFLALAVGCFMSVMSLLPWVIRGFARRADRHARMVTQPG